VGRKGAISGLLAARFPGVGSSKGKTWPGGPGVRFRFGVRPWEKVRKRRGRVGHTEEKSPDVGLGGQGVKKTVRTMTLNTGLWSFPA